MAQRRRPWFKDWDGAKAAGIARGAYHFARPRYPMSTAASDARAFVAVLKANGGTGESPRRSTSRSPADSRRRR